MESSVENICTHIRVSSDKVFHSPNTRAFDLLTSTWWKVTSRFLATSDLKSPDWSHADHNVYCPKSSLTKELDNKLPGLRIRLKLMVMCVTKIAFASAGVEKWRKILRDILS